MTFEFHGHKHVAEVAELVTEEMKKNTIPKINLISIKPEIRSQSGRRTTLNSLHSF